MESSSTPSFPPCPCKDCICVAVCRLKDYFLLVSNCKLVSLILYSTKYIGRSGRSRNFNQTVYKIHDALSPRYWRISRSSTNNDELKIVDINLIELNP